MTQRDQMKMAGYLGEYARKGLLSGDYQMQEDAVGLAIWAFHWARAAQQCRDCLGAGHDGCYCGGKGWIERSASAIGRLHP